MGLQKLILNIILGFLNIFVKRFKIKENQVAFVSLESKYLDSDMKLIYDVLKQDKQLNLKKVVIEYDQQGIKQNFLYMLNCIQQLFVINTSKVVIIRDNNYVVSTFKREGVNVIQVWHACGAIKKFGNALARKYPIKNYDYVIANSSYWKKPYSEAFSVKEENVLDHHMHSEFYIISEEVADKLNKAKANGQRIIAVGTTSTRTLEANMKKYGKFKATSENTDIFIYPGYKFEAIDCLITNFHLPKSTLLMLISAFASKELIFKAYKEAVKEKYRFFSFGDSMMIL